MQVHFVYLFFHPVVGGVETWMHEMGRRLAGWGHEVTVHAVDRTLRGERLEPRAEVDGIQVVRYRPVVFRGTFQLFYRPRIPDGSVVDLQGYPLPVGDGVRMTRRRKVVLVSTPRGAPYRATTPGARFGVQVYDQLLGLPTLRRCRRVVVMTANETRWLAARHVPEDRIVEVRTGVAEEGFRPRDPTRARAELGVERYLLFVGRLYHEKGPQHLVEALGGIAASHPGVHAVFAGPDQGEAARMEARARALGIADRVHLLGAVPEERKWELLAGCEALVLPSLWEAQGTVVQEAWAQGRPAVVSRVGGVPFCVHDQRDAVLVEPGDVAGLAQALDGLLRDPARADAMGKAGRAEAETHYRWDGLARRLEAVYAAAAADPLR